MTVIKDKNVKKNLGTLLLKSVTGRTGNGLSGVGFALSKMQ